MNSMPKLTFLGATGTVTGSKYLLEAGGTRVLVDCGLFQGQKPLRQRNWRPLPFDAATLDAVVLTHAHLDHSGYIPALIKQGYTGPVFCSPGTAALARVLLPDSGYLQEEDARFANRKGFSRHRPALPLYTQAEAEASLDSLRPVAFDKTIKLADDVKVSLRPAGHIIGASWLRFTLGTEVLTFSGDLGRAVDPVMKPPAALEPTDYLVLESTYGNKVHDNRSPLEALRDVVNDTVSRKGILMIPAFAVGRAQTVLHLLATLLESGEIPDVPIFLNSPMAIDATEIFCDHPDEHRLLSDKCRAMCNVTRYVNSAEESRALNQRSGPMVVISASGMATGGRILHHFKAWLGNSRNTVLFTGFQAAGTRGAAMIAGAKSVKIHGQTYSIKADIRELHSLSAHADSDELLDWIRPLSGRLPKTVFVTHGEQTASIALRDRISSELGFDVQVPEDGQTATLT